MKKIYLLVNTHAGSHTAASIYNKLLQKLDKQGVSYESFVSAYAGEMTILAKKVANLNQNNPNNCLLVIGGDGSLNQALNGLKSSRFPDTALAYLPCGTGNDFARALHLTKDIDKLIDILTSPTIIKKVDCGYYYDHNKKKGNYFVNNLGIGFDAYVVAQTNNSKLEKHFNNLKIGNLTYGLNILKALANQNTFQVTVTEHGKIHHFNDAYLVTTTNHPYFGGGVPILPNANPFSHKLDTVVVEKPSIFRFLHLFAKLLKNGSHVSAPEFHYYEASKLNVRTQSLEYGQLDGEELGTNSFDLVFSINNFNLIDTSI